jgi:TRAP-type C4-dicarboxylate transport system permease small subunit
MVHPFCAFFFFFFCFGGWRTTLMAASNTAFMFWVDGGAKQQQSVTTNTANEELNAESSPRGAKEKNHSTCWVFELHSMYAAAPISFLSSSPCTYQRSP